MGKEANRDQEAPRGWVDDNEDLRKGDQCQGEANN